jgi:hypothetical protein
MAIAAPPRPVSAAPAPKLQLYEPRGAARGLFYNHEGEVLLAGPAGTGKSRAALEKMHLCAMKYDGMRGLILRKTRESLTEAALVTFESKVLPPYSPIAAGNLRRVRQSYSYPNGSELVIGGLDKPSKVMSTDYDMVFVQEATELTENDWESLTSRMRNGVMPYQQLLADCNPGPPTHWLKKRADRGQVQLLESRHEDNPALWDRERGDWTPRGQAYITRLDGLTAAEGMVYDGWDPAVHLADRFERTEENPRGDPPADWPRVWVVDFGYTNPFCWQAWAIDPDGRLFRYREIYMSRRLVEDHARQILEVCAGEPMPMAIICDHDAEDRATLERHVGMRTIAAIKWVAPGVQAVQARLRPAGDGKPRLFLMRDALVQRDPSRDELRRPACTEEEFDTYVWATKGDRVREEPLKQDDHGMDAVRYLVMAFDAPAEPDDEYVSRVDDSERVEISPV